jgi:hypothetical protein
MKQQLLTVFLAGSMLLLLATCKSVRPATIPYGSYQIECVGGGSQGYQLVKVSVYAGAKEVRKTGINELRRCAVHGVIFKGYAGGNGCTPQKPMATNPASEQQNAGFFQPFFNRDQAFNKYASEVKGNAMERTRVGNEFKLSAVINVAKDMLRRDLEAAGVLGGLSGGF